MSGKNSCRKININYPKGDFGAIVLHQIRHLRRGPLRLGHHQPVPRGDHHFLRVRQRRERTVLGGEGRGGHVLVQLSVK